jgi:hypothetical protein
MARFSVKYKTIQNGKPSMGTKGTIVTASNMWEARQAFKYSHIDAGTIKYVIVAVLKIGN